MAVILLQINRISSHTHSLLVLWRAGTVCTANPAMAARKARPQGTATTTVQASAAAPPPTLLKLTLAKPKTKAVSWGDDVIDNEGMNRRRSNKC